MKLSKRIPARTKTLKINFIKKEWMENGVYNGCRKKAGMKETFSCGWCKRPFKGQDMMALAVPEKGRNLLLCRKCADEATKDKAPSEDRALGT